jgi:hypothetical protein
MFPGFVNYPPERGEGRVYKNRGSKGDIKCDQKVSVHMMITIHKVTSNVQSVSRQSPDIY